jgi:hypothetical protein
MAVPAAMMSIVSGMCVNASIITRVSSQSDRFSGRHVLPASALMISALLQILLEEGN